MVITIDGETYTMKSTIAKLIANRFGFIHISCGIIYRALTLVALKSGVDLEKQGELIGFTARALKNMTLSLDSILYLGEELDREHLDGTDVFGNCDKFSTCLNVVAEVNMFVRNYATTRNVVIDGRESGTVLFPDAQFKFYFLADPKRFVDPTHGDAMRLASLKAINERDKAAGIVKCPEDAICLRVEAFNDPEHYALEIEKIVTEKIIGTIKRGTTYSLVPARSGSRGCRDKNIKKLAGHALIEYPIRVSKLVPEIEQVVFSSDSAEYGAIAKNAGAYVPFLRPAELATPTSTDLDFFTHAVYMLYGLNHSLPEFFMLLRATSPLRDPKLVREALTILKINDRATSIRTAHEATKSPYKMFSVDSDGFYHSLIWDVSIDDINVPRQILPKVYVPNGYVDIFRTENIIRTHTLYGERVLGYETSEVVDIDTLEDFIKAEKIIMSEPQYDIFSEENNE